MNYVLIITMSYLIGSIPFSYLIPKWFNRVDIRKHGSGNTGTTNVFRTLGAKAGTLAFIGDFLKGTVPVLITIFNFQHQMAIWAALFAVIGHCYPVWLNFKGGKGVATSAGAVLMLMPQVFLALFFVQFILIFSTRIMSVASISSGLLIGILAWIIGYETPYIIFSLLLGAFVIYKHRDNIKRLLQGTENKLNFQKKR